MTRAAGAAVAGLLLAAVGLWYAAAGWHPSDQSYPQQGIDVSHHQGAIDWAALPAQGVDFAYIKASEGGDYRDDRFAQNWAAAARAGVPRGAYHFFTLCRSGAEQAANFIAAVPRGTMLPPAVDLEFLGNCRARLPADRVLPEVRAFVTRIEAHYGQQAILYLTREFDQAYGVSAAISRPLWLRSLVFAPTWSPRPWTLWQASNFRRLRGIDGRVDWNVRTGGPTA